MASKFKAWFCSCVVGDWVLLRVAGDPFSFGVGLSLTGWGELWGPEAAMFWGKTDDAIEDEWLAPAEDCGEELLDSTTGGEAGNVEAGAGDGESKLMTGGELTGSLDMTASSSSSELSKVKSMTGPFEGLVAAEVEVVDAAVSWAGEAAVVVAVTDDDKRTHFFTKII